jgi:WD40 repeat protein
VHAVALSADGKLALTGGDDNVARVWDVATARPLGPPLRHPRPVMGVAFWPDGKTLLTADQTDFALFRRGEDMATRAWRLPEPVSGGPERLTLWAEVRTGLELRDSGEVRLLDADAWRQRKRKLEALAP